MYGFIRLTSLIVYQQKLNICDEKKLKLPLNIINELDLSCASCTFATLGILYVFGATDPITLFSRIKVFKKNILS